MIFKTLFICFLAYKVNANYIPDVEEEPEIIIYDLNDAKEIFDEFLSTFNKTYSTQEEYHRRYNIFVENVEEINSKNLNGNSTVFGITEFTDLTWEEFQARYTGLRGFSQMSNVLASEIVLLSEAAPENLDWREKGVVTAVKNQGNCASCWAFSAVGVVESQYAIKHQKLHTLSEKQLVDCFKQGNGCRTGSFPDRALNNVAKYGGLMASKDYPYKPKQDSCSFKKEKIVVKVKGGKKVSVKNEDQLKKMVHQYGPVSIGIFAGKAFEYYKGHIFEPTAADCPVNRAPNHAVIVVGYGNEKGKPYWIIKNSFDRTWGEQGYMKLIRGKNACNILNYAAIAEIP